MLSDLLAPKKIPEWIPDVVPINDITIDDSISSFVTDVNNPLNPLPLPNDPVSQDPVENNVLQNANDIISGISTISFDKTLLEEPLTAQPLILMMVLDEVKRQQTQVDNTQKAIKQVKDDTLLSAFRSIQAKTLDYVTNYARKFIDKILTKKQKLPTYSKSDKALPTIEMQALQELANLAYLNTLKNTPSTPTDFFTVDSLLHAAKAEILASRTIDLFSTVLGTGITGDVLSLAYNGMASALTDSTEILEELVSFATRDQIDTVNRLKSFDDLNAQIELISALANNDVSSVFSDDSSTNIENTYFQEQ